MNIMTNTFVKDFVFSLLYPNNILAQAAFTLLLAYFLQFVEDEFGFPFFVVSWKLKCSLYSPASIFLLLVSQSCLYLQLYIKEWKLGFLD